MDGALGAAFDKRLKLTKKKSTKVQFGTEFAYWLAENYNYIIRIK